MSDVFPPPVNAYPFADLAPPQHALGAMDFDEFWWCGAWPARRQFYYFPLPRLSIAHRRIQYPVGQGFLHAGLLATSRTAARSGSLLYVYDCGAMRTFASACGAAVKSFHADSQRRRIDLLFLSHVHFDHVSGLEQLLDRRTGSRVDTIVMPLLTPVERLMTFARATAAAPTAATPFYCDLIVDPVAALAERFGPRQIMLVGRGEGRAPGLDGLPDGGPDTGVSAAPDCAPWRLVGRGVSRLSSETTGATTVHETPDTLAIAVPGDGGRRAWQFLTFVDPGIVTGRADFLTALRELLKWSPKKLRDAISSTAGLKSLVIDRRAELAEAYMTLDRDLNVTSLCLYSGPLGSGVTDIWMAGRDDIVQFGTARTAWLGSGDANLHTAAHRNPFLAHFGAHLDRVATLTLPHHGSERSFHAGLLKAVKPRLCVAAADHVKGWRHPGTSVIQDVASAGAHLQVVTAGSSALIEDVFVG